VAAKFDVLLDAVLVDLATLQVLLRTTVVVEAQLLEHLQVKVDPFVVLEVRLERNRIKGKRSAGEQSELLDFFVGARGFEEA
jgi:hypothetical protein